MSRQVPPHQDAACWGCGDNALGLQLPLPEREGIEDYEAFVEFDERHQGGPGFVHGGMVAAALDEAAGLLATWHSFPTVTVRIFVRFRLAVPINTELLLRAELESVRGRQVRVRARLTDGTDPLAEARAAFLHVPLEHFLATPEGRAAADRWETRLGSRLADDTT